jgi:hypothetical protein
MSIPQPTPATQPPALTQRQTKAIATTQIKAKTLFWDGYTIDPTNQQSIYKINIPTPRLDKKTGEITEFYMVDLLAETCTCKQFEFSSLGICKHLDATRKAISVALRLVSPAQLPRATRQDDFAYEDDFGNDPFDEEATR